MTEAESARFIALDEEGYFMLDGLRMADQAVGAEWLASLRIDELGRAVAKTPDDTIVEAFDQPLVANDIEQDPASKGWLGHFPYGFQTEVDIESLRFDEWDRFYVRTKNGVPAVLNRAAQSRLFQSAEEYDDDSVTLSGLRLELKPQYEPSAQASGADFWSTIYRSEQPRLQPRWDLGQAHPLLDSLIPPLKLSRCRVLVLGCGAGHDANWWSQRGHIVTGVDFSGEAIARARALYGESESLRWLERDAFALAPDLHGRFDLIFEHTFFCAVSPDRRDELVRAWRRLLAPGGRVLGFAPMMDKTFGPPFGVSEWEFRQRLLIPDRKNKTLENSARFRPLLWQRLRNSPGRRLGRELFFAVEKAN